MKYILISIIFILTLNSCADRSAFSKFGMKQDQELSAASLKSSKIIQAGKLKGVITSVYLNEVYPNTFSVDEYFYLYIYQKEKNKMFNPNSLDDIELTLKLNGSLPLKITELPTNNKFSHLTSIKSDWQRYFLVAFKEQSEDTLNLTLHSKNGSSQKLVYSKNDE